LQHAALVIRADGRSWLVTANRCDETSVADEARFYEAQWNATQRSNQPGVIAELVAGYLKESTLKRVGVDASGVASQVMLLADGVSFQSVEPEIAEMRRVKCADELALMRIAINCSRAMYETARAVIKPGVNELDVYTALSAAAVKEAGEPMSAFLGNDYVCGAGGGTARKNGVAQDGQLYILDLGPSFRGYFADNARTFSVNREPTDAQLKAWRGVVGVFPMIEQTVRPGVRCRDVVRAASSHLETTTGLKLNHHLGHGVGLEPHEAPHLNLKWDDTFQEGEVFTVEPGVYSPELAGGMRIENQYLVTKSGVENLTPFPLELV
jgi:Xaa-Pro aminopeptidase